MGSRTPPLSEAACVYDSCCGSGGMFVQSEKFVEAHGGNRTDVSVFGQESSPTTWRLAHMNLAIHGIEANLGPTPADTFLRPQHPDLKADFVANPPFNVSDYSGPLFQGDKRWTFGAKSRCHGETFLTFGDVAGWETRLIESLPTNPRGSLPTIEELEAELSCKPVPMKAPETHRCLSNSISDSVV